MVSTEYGRLVAHNVGGEGKRGERGGLRKGYYLTHSLSCDFHKQYVVCSNILEVSVLVGEDSRWYVRVHTPCI